MHWLLKMETPYQSPITVAVKPASPTESLDALVPLRIERCEVRRARVVVGGAEANTSVTGS